MPLEVHVSIEAGVLILLIIECILKTMGIFQPSSLHFKNTIFGPKIVKAPQHYIFSEIRDLIEKKSKSLILFLLLYVCTFLNFVL